MQSKPGERLYLTRAEVARLLEVSPSSISRWARQGKLPSVQTVGGRRRYHKEGIRYLIQKLSMAVRPGGPAAQTYRSDKKKGKDKKPCCQPTKKEEMP